MNMNQMMKQVKKMQQEMEKAQEALKEKTVQGSAGGVVTVTANGHKEILSVQIKPEAVDPEDVELLQDLILTATNDALKKVDELVQQDLGRFTGGLNLPGLF
ncbi:DNA binding protein [[Clostridium] ultunense Esp]|uniref:YbaB/EbfC family nucleoid-associated protein n=1 Tax=Thermicanus aegyptius TaxID=94009 RepID=UPI0002B6FC4E|nr:YbaB/EbfC family nucleoid-associated protein [Thermicanus aegyptius]CCQ94088.1 DNA binding protein [[Clostridium] ultunense Esp]